MNRLWKCAECGKEGMEQWADMVRENGYHFASDANPRCTGKLVFVDRRRAHGLTPLEKKLLARCKELRNRLESAPLSCDCDICRESRAQAIAAADRAIAEAEGRKP